jgi:D-sedoheptulose 7-phosphate isomerase
MNLSTSFPDDVLLTLSECVNILKSAYFKGNKVILCGNGGSASDSQHIVGELMKSFLRQRLFSPSFKDKVMNLLPDDYEYMINNLQPPIEAISLLGETSLISAWINDANPDFVFAQQVLGYGKKGDVLIALSTSGKSINVINAMKIAKVMGMKVILMTGNSDLGNEEHSRFIDLVIKSSSSETFIVQEDHIKFYHYICMNLETMIFEN